jgi:hypothetical protein
MTTRARSRAFWPAVLVGCGFAGVGAAVAFGAPGDDGRPLGIAAVVAGAVVVHDLFLAPAAHRVGSSVSKRCDPAVAGPVRAALAVSAILAVFAFPLVTGLGRRPTNSSALPLPYGRALAALLVAVWLAAAGVILARRRRSR